MHRKIALRRDLLKAAGPGAVFLPFCGDGDIAADLYADRDLFAIDIDPARIATIAPRLARPNSRFLTSSADSWPGDEATTLTYAIGDFDSYAYPYDAFRGFWQHAPKADRLVLFFTDGMKQAIIRVGSWRNPDGTKQKTKVLAEKRAKASSYWSKTVEPWFRDAVKPWRVVRTFSYTRGGGMLYWGAIVEKPKDASQLTGDDARKARAAKKPTPIRSKAKAKPAKKRAKKIDPDDAALGDPLEDDGNAQEWTDEELGFNPLKVGKFGPLKKRRFLQLLSEGAARGDAARLVGVTLRTVEKHVHEYPGFKQAVELVGTDMNSQVVNALFQAAKSGNVTAIQVWLYNRAPDEWKDKRNVSIETKVDWEAEIARIVEETGAPESDVRREYEEMLHRRRLHAVK